MGIIYCWTNKNTTKKYIGQTIKPVHRMRNHIYEAFVKGSDFYFHRSLRKHGLDAFVYEILEEVEDHSKLDERENFYIDKFNTIWPHGYNQQHARTMSLSSINKMSQTKKEQWASMTEEERKESVVNRGLTMTGKKQTENQKKKVSEALAKKWIITTPDGIELEVVNLRQWCLGQGIKNTGNLVSVASGKFRHYKGYKCRRA